VMRAVAVGLLVVTLVWGLPSTHDVNTLEDDLTLKSEDAAGAGASHNIQVANWKKQYARFGALFDLGRKMAEEAAEADKNTELGESRDGAAPGKKSKKELGETSSPIEQPAWEYTPPRQTVKYQDRGTWKDWTTEGAKHDPQWSCTFCDKSCDAAHEDAFRKTETANEDNDGKDPKKYTNPFPEDKWSHGLDGRKTPYYTHEWKFKPAKCLLDCRQLACQLTNRCQC